MARCLSENDMYAVLRYALIAQFASEDFLDAYDLNIKHYQQIYDFLKNMYFNYSKYRYGKEN